MADEIIRREFIRDIAAAALKGGLAGAKSMEGA